MLKDVIRDLFLEEKDVEYYGKDKVKINFENFNNNRKGKLILVTAMTPTPYGEGKTTVSIGLADGLRKIGKKSLLALREPSLGPVFGMKGGATGGGKSFLIPKEDINLHFTGDIHAITTANNLLCACIDNHIYFGNKLNIDPKKINIKRCIDINDRSLRNIIIGLGKSNGEVREDGFCISVATEIMAILCLSKDIVELRNSLDNIIIAKNYNNENIYAKDLGITGSLIVLLKEAIKPNMVQTNEGTPALVHGGPFANIAHGCNSIIATDLALKLGDYVITEAGFGADLGAEKFFDIKCRRNNFDVSCIVLVVTIRAIKYHGDDNLIQGFNNVKRHLENLRRFNHNVLIVLNKFENDSNEDINQLKQFCNENITKFSISNGFSEGGDGCIDLAQSVIELCENNHNQKYIYDINESLDKKIQNICNFYGGNSVRYSIIAFKKLNEYMNIKLPICVAKTQYSFTDDSKILNAPLEFNINVDDIELKNGAGFIVVYIGNILTMPGLSQYHNAEKIDFIENKIVGI